MSKKVYFGTSAARRVKRIYLGIGGMARKVRRAYIGVEGVARACLGAGAVIRAGQAEPLGDPAWLGAAAHAGERLLFGGGSSQVNGAFRATVTAYDAHLTKTAAQDLSTSRQEVVGASLGEMALFAGGDTGSRYQDAVDVYDAALTRSLTYLYSARSKMAAGTLAGRAIFAGGYGGGSQTAVDLFDSALTRTTMQLKTARYHCAGAVTGNYFLVAGGASTVKSVEVFDQSFTRTAADDLSVGRYAMQGLTHMGRAMIVGGWGESGAVDVYDESLTHTVFPSQSAVKGFSRGAALENFAIFHGGRDNNWGIHADTVVFDESFTAAPGPALSAQRWGEGAGTVGGYALFAGGGSSSAASATVDIFTLE